MTTKALAVSILRVIRGQVIMIVVNQMGYTFCLFPVCTRVSTQACDQTGSRNKKDQYNCPKTHDVKIKRLGQ